MNRATHLLVTELVCCFSVTSVFFPDNTKSAGVAVSNFPKDKADSKLDCPGRSFKNLTDDGAWFWFPDPKAIYYEGKHKRTYFGWVNKAGNVRVGCYDHETKETTDAILRERLNPDSHSVGALLVRPDGRLIAFYARHYDKKASLYRISNCPEDISSWSDEREVTTGGGYSDFVNAIQLTKEDNKNYLFRRGDNFSTSNDAVHWTPARKLMERMWPRRGHAPYLKVASNGIDTIHFALVECGPTDSPDVRTSIYYACYHDGAFYRADGTTIKSIEDLPIKRAEAEKVYDGNSSGFSAWLGDIGIDAAGNPVIVYHVYVTYCKDGRTDLRYRYARWSRNQWEEHEITPAPSSRARGCYPAGGITLDHAHPSIVYLSKPTSGVYEIERWMTSDGGATWTSEYITSGSEKDNIRPVVPRGYKGGDVGLIWMHGDYLNTDGARYGDYDTVLKFK